MLPSLLLSILAQVVSPVAVPWHLVWAERLLADLQPAHNRYAGPPARLSWRGVDGAATSGNSSDCSGFVTVLLGQAYGLGGAALRRWLGSANPTAAHYHDAIARADGFEPIETAGAIRPGDLLAIRYRRPPDGAGRGSTVTGHLMLAAAGPRVLSAGRLALVVIDSSRTGHGPDDRRGPQGGAGRGTIALFVDGADRPVAYAWSLRPDSARRGPPQEDLRIGRLLTPAGSPGR